MVVPRRSSRGRDSTRFRLRGYVPQRSNTRRLACPVPTESTYEMDPVFVLRPKPWWRWSLTYLAGAAAWGIVTADKLEDVVGGLVFILVAIWSWLQRLELVGSQLHSHWRLYRESVDLATLTSVDVFSMRRLELGPATFFVPTFFNAVFLSDERENSTRFTRGWWQHSRRLLEVIDNHIEVGEDEEGEPQWRIELDERTQWVLYKARVRADLARPPD